MYKRQACQREILFITYFQIKLIWILRYNQKDTSQECDEIKKWKALHFVYSEKDVLHQDAERVSISIMSTL